jgi:hypothetical protein
MVKKIMKEQLTSKIKKRMKFTKKKLQIDSEKIKKTIQAIKKINSNLIEKTGLEFFNNVYLYIILQKKLDCDGKKFKNRFFKLPSKIITEENKLKVCFINHGLKSKDKKDVDILEKLDLGDGDGDSIEILSTDEFKALVKNTKNRANLNFIYNNILCDDRLVTKNRQILGNDLNKLDICNYNVKMKQKALYEHLSKLVDISKSSSLLKSVDDKLFTLKAANCSMDDKNILINIVRLIYKSVAWILENSQKHNCIKSIVVKSENSPPFSIYNDIDADDLTYFE